MLLSMGYLPQKKISIPNKCWTFSSSDSPENMFSVKNKYI